MKIKRYIDGNKAKKFVTLHSGECFRIIDDSCELSPDYIKIKTSESTMVDLDDGFVRKNGDACFNSKRIAEVICEVVNATVIISKEEN